MEATNFWFYHSTTTSTTTATITTAAGFHSAPIWGRGGGGSQINNMQKLCNYSNCVRQNEDHGQFGNSHLQFSNLILGLLSVYMLTTSSTECGWRVG